MQRMMTAEELIALYNAGERNFSHARLQSTRQGWKPSLSGPGLNLSEIDLSNAFLHEVTLHGSFNNANFEGATLEGAQLSGSFQNVSFSGAEMAKTVMSGDFSGADFSDALMHGVNASGANLQRARFCRALLNRSQLWEADLTGADLTDAGLPGAVLTRTKLHNAKLRGANLSETEVRDAEFYDADLTEAVFGKAKGSPSLRGALLDRTNFYDAGPEIRQYFDVIVDEAAPSAGTITPDGRTLPSVGRAPLKRSSDPSSQTTGDKPRRSTTGYLWPAIKGIIAGAFFGAAVMPVGSWLGPILTHHWSSLARAAGNGAVGGVIVGLVISFFYFIKSENSNAAEFAFAGAIMGAIAGAVVGLPSSLIQHMIYTNAAPSTGNWALVGAVGGAAVGLLASIGWELSTRD